MHERISQPELLRMLDANANRACEGLRVLEDAARFALDDRDLCARVKAIRHELRGALGEAQGADALALLASRDSVRDVGTGVDGAGEFRRCGLADIVHAAAGRTGEALRVIEEVLKSLEGKDAAKRVQDARYALYEVHRAIGLRLGSAARRQWRVCVLVTESLCRLPWQRVVEESLAGGADAIQLREKTLADRELLARARWVVAACRGAGAAGDTAGTGVAAIVNDRVDIALAAGADGVHVGQGDLPLRVARAMAGSRLLIGVSTERIEQAREAVREGADVCGLGPMFPTTTKRKERLAGPGYVREYLDDAATRLTPHLAIGGVTPANAGLLASAGCAGVAVSSVVCGSAEPGVVVRELVAEVGGSMHGAANAREA